MYLTCHGLKPKTKELRDKMSIVKIKDRRQEGSDSLEKYRLNMVLCSAHIHTIGVDTVCQALCSRVQNEFSF